MRPNINSLKDVRTNLETDRATRVSRVLIIASRNKCTFGVVYGHDVPELSAILSVEDGASLTGKRMEVSLVDFNGLWICCDVTKNKRKREVFFYAHFLPRLEVETQSPEENSIKLIMIEYLGNGAICEKNVSEKSFAVFDALYPWVSYFSKICFNVSSTFCHTNMTL